MEASVGEAHELTAAQRTLHSLWWRPGGQMSTGWWANIGLLSWQSVYMHQPLLRPDLDRVIVRRLGHEKPVPSMGPLGTLVLGDTDRCEMLCQALGLWALSCPDYLLLRSYRDVLSSTFSQTALTQLQFLMPSKENHSPTVEPGAVPETARSIGAAWLARSKDKSLIACRLLWDPPTQHRLPDTEPDSILEKLARWM